MAHWALGCPNCNEVFTHSNIVPDASLSLDPFTWNVIKPEFPEGGLRMACPNCKTEHVYQRYQLTYQAT
jgi:hypothetical protein